MLKPAQEVQARLSRLESIVSDIYRVIGLQIPHESAGLITGIQCLVARHYGISPAQLLGRCRRVEFARPRFVAIYLCHKHARATLTTLGSHFKRHHTAIVHALQRIESDLETCRRLRAEVLSLETQLTALLPAASQNLMVDP